MEFPHLVEMHKRYAKDGLEVVSVSLDNPGDEDDALQFLRSMRPRFPTLLLTARSGLQAEFDFESIPCIFVFDKAGQRRKFEGAFSFGDVERVVREFLKQ